LEFFLEHSIRIQGNQQATDPLLNVVKTDGLYFVTVVAGRTHPELGIEGIVRSPGLTRKARQVGLFREASIRYRVALNLVEYLPLILGFEV
jgi:hypothetical protein